MSVLTNDCWAGIFDAEVIIIDPKNMFERKIWNEVK